MSRKCVRGRGFTLIELLVVIAIIAVLAGILFPVIRGVREKTRQTKCMANLMALNQALRAYQADYHRYPFRPYWDSGLNRYVGGVSALYPDYINDKSAFICPNDRVQSPPDGYSTYNGVIVGSGSDAWEFESQSGGTGSSGELCKITYNYGGLNEDGWDMSRHDGTNWITEQDPVGGAVPAWLAADGKRWRGYPRLMNPRAPDNTVTIHCHAHRSFYGSDSETIKWRDPIVRLGGQTQTVSYSQWQTPAGSPMWTTQK